MKKDRRIDRATAYLLWFPLLVAVIYIAFVVFVVMRAK